MSSLRTPPRPALARVTPAYPRLLAIGALLLAGCGGKLEGDSAPTPSPTPDPAGGISYPYDSEPVKADTGTDTKPEAAADTGSSETGDPPSAGGEPYPFDADPTPSTDAGTPSEAAPAPPTPAPTPTP